MTDETKEISPKKKQLDPKDFTICEATAQMIAKARKDGVETAFDRAANMKACPIGADSACCKHCAMGPCRLNAKDPYSKVGVCGATIDTIMARNFARMVAAGGAAHTDHGMGMLDLFREVLNGHIKDYTIKSPQKLIEVAQSIGIETEDRELKDIAMDLYAELERTYTQVEGEIPFAKRVPEKTLETWRKLGIVPRGAMREIMELMHRTHMGAMHELHNFTHGPAGNDSQLAPGFQGFFRDPLGKGNFSFDLGVGSFKFRVQVHGDIFEFPIFGFNSNGLGDFYKLLWAFDRVVFYMAVEHFAEKIEHTHTMVGMSGTAGSDHAGEISSHNRIDGGTAHAHFGIRVFGIEPTGPHGAVLTTSGVRPDGAGFHIGRTIKRGFDAIFASLCDHLGRGLADGEILGIELLFFRRNFFCFVSHLMPPFLEQAISIKSD